MKEMCNGHILIVDDRPENLMVLESVLDGMGCTIIKATSGNEALGLMLEYNFALVLLDVQMPEMDGFETAELMRGSERTRYIPIIFVTAISKEERCILKGYAMGAVDYLFKPIEPVVLKSKVKVFMEIYNQKELLKEQARLLKLKIKELTELQDANCKLENLSFTDGLTGISNRRSFDQYIEKSWKNSIRSRKPLSLIMVDIDYFKAFNDNYGHVKGDECLIQIAKTMASTIKRPMDFIGRYGGEEFTVVLPDTDLDGAVIIAEEIRKNIEDKAIPHDYSLTAKHVTVSLGVTTIIPGGTDELEGFIHRADRAMYTAKQSGEHMGVVLTTSFRIKRGIYRWFLIDYYNINM